MPSLKSRLSSVLTREELSHVKTSYDIMGDVAIIEIPDKLEHRELIIAKEIVHIHKHVRVVAKKVGAVSGDFRVRPLKIILCLRDAAQCNTETTLKENGVLIKLDPSKVFYSIRLGTERDRIAKMVRDGEHVLVMFAGVGPFAFVIAKAKRVDVVGVEWNPVAITYFNDNIHLNKRLKGHITSVLGDVRDVIPNQYPSWADRIVMPLPKTADDFLNIAIVGARDGAFIHTYTFMNEETWKHDVSRWASEKCNSLCDKYHVKLELESLIIENV